MLFRSGTRHPQRRSEAVTARTGVLGEQPEHLHHVPERLFPGCPPKRHRQMPRGRPPPPPPPPSHSSTVSPTQESRGHVFCVHLPDRPPCSFPDALTAHTPGPPNTARIQAVPMGLRAEGGPLAPSTCPGAGPAPEGLLLYALHTRKPQPSQPASLHPGVTATRSVSTQSFS